MHGQLESFGSLQTWHVCRIGQPQRFVFKYPEKGTNCQERPCLYNICFEAPVAGKTPSAPQTGWRKWGYVQDPLLSRSLLLADFLSQCLPTMAMGINHINSLCMSPESPPGTPFVPPGSIPPDVLPRASGCNGAAPKSGARGFGAARSQDIHFPQLGEKLEESFGGLEKNKGGVLLWMDKILHDFEAVTNHCLLAFTGDPLFQGFLSGAKWISSIHSSSFHWYASSSRTRLLNGLPKQVQAVCCHSHDLPKKT